MSAFRSDWVKQSTVRLLCLGLANQVDGKKKKFFGLKTMRQASSHAKVI